MAIRYVIRCLAPGRFVKSPAKAGSVKPREVDKAVKKIALLRGAGIIKSRSAYSSKRGISAELRRVSIPKSRSAPSYNIICL